MQPIDDASLAQLFTNAQTHNGFDDKPVSEETLRSLYDLFKWGPTSFNCQPARLVIVISQQAKTRLLPALLESNAAKTLAAPATAIIAQDNQFYDHLPRFYPAVDAKPIFASDSELAQATAFRNSSLQGGYLILAARALGLACGPMSGFDANAINNEFFPDGRLKVNFICNIGYAANPVIVYPRNERFDFDEVCSIV